LNPYLFENPNLRWNFAVKIPPKSSGAPPRPIEKAEKQAENFRIYDLDIIN
jgi:hypothetical protein